MLRRLIRQTSSAMAAQVDHAFVEGFIKQRRAAPSAATAALSPAQVDERLDLIEALAARYAPHTGDEARGDFFAPPAVITASQTRVRALSGGGQVVDLCWESGYAPFNEEVAAAYLRAERNRVCHARLFEQPGQGRPVVILVHGYRGGHFGVEERVWPIEAYRRAGLDVALFVMPHHGARQAPERARPPFPSADPRLTIEGMRQAIHDLRALMGALKARGACAVGVSGMSLGGYVSALLTTLEPQLAFSVPVIPLACFADFGRDANTLLGDSAQQARHYDALKAMCRIISPLEGAAAITPHHIMVIAGEADQVTPVHHARQIAAHLGAPLKTFPGGHLFQLGRQRAFDEAIALMCYGARP